MTAEYLHGDCREVMRTLEAESVDAIVTDPPYGLTFMGKDWDNGVPGEVFWREALRVTKPGAHLLAFGGTRTFHRLACAIEDAGWEIRDTVMWVYGSGFPKSLDVSKAIDKAAGAEREEILGPKISPDGLPYSARKKTFQTNGSNDGYKRPSDSNPRTELTAPATTAARQWDGWGTALKPAVEMICLARKPLIGTVAANVLAHGTGAINIDGCRVGTEKGWPVSESTFTGWEHAKNMPTEPRGIGRWPANVIHDGSDEVLAAFPYAKSRGEYTLSLNRQPAERRSSFGSRFDVSNRNNDYACESGSAARFFYTAKASQDDRNFGLGSGNRSGHPTVKPTDLMRYLCRLVTPPGGLVLDPFMGSGSTGVAAKLEHFRFIGIEQDAAYIEIARNRGHHTQAQVAMFA